MKHNLKTLLAFGGLLLGLTLIFVFINRLWDVQDPETFVIKRTDQTTTQWDRILQQKDTENAKIITNVYDGYEITIPKNWLAPQKSPSALRLYSYEQLQYRTEKNQIYFNFDSLPFVFYSRRTSSNGYLFIHGHLFILGLQNLGIQKPKTCLGRPLFFSGGNHYFWFLDSQV